MTNFSVIARSAKHDVAIHIAFTTLRIAALAMTEELFVYFNDFSNHFTVHAELNCP
jgi:hypothetical protein